MKGIVHHREVPILPDWYGSSFPIATVEKETSTNDRHQNNGTTRTAADDSCSIQRVVLLVTCWGTTSVVSDGRRGEFNIGGFVIRDECVGEKVEDDDFGFVWEKAIVTAPVDQSVVDKGTDAADPTLSCRWALSPGHVGDVQHPQIGRVRATVQQSSKDGNLCSVIVFIKKK